MSMVYEVTAPIWLWSTDAGAWHFLTLPAETAAGLKALSGPRRGFGSLRVAASIGEVCWRTSVFPDKSGSFVLPVKAEVRRRTGLSVGDMATVRIELEI
jgi:hypothetical protein